MHMLITVYKWLYDIHVHSYEGDDDILYQIFPPSTTMVLHVFDNFIVEDMKCN